MKITIEKSPNQERLFYHVVFCVGISEKSTVVITVSQSVNRLKSRRMGLPMR